MAKREIPEVYEKMKIEVFNSLTKKFEVMEYPAAQAINLLAMGKKNGFFKPYLENEITVGAGTLPGEPKTEIVTNS